jgi:prolyl-tRNA editing enzyme YbaK/EbsC (Cys-tRNA(Pro) deacylase)
MATLIFSSALKRPDLVAQPVLNYLQTEQYEDLKAAVLVAEIDPIYAGGEDLCRHYGVDPASGGNCVIVESRRGDRVGYASVIAPVGARMDLNGAVRRQLGARTVTIPPRDFALAETHMEYGSITPVGLPDSWAVLVDDSFMHHERVIVGGGRVNSKLSVPSALLRLLPNACVLRVTR